jgi:hypothetical protein
VATVVVRCRSPVDAVVAGALLVEGLPVEGGLAPAEDAVTSVLLSVLPPL